MRLVSQKPIGGNNTNLELFSIQNSLQPYGTSMPKRVKQMSSQIAPKLNLWCMALVGKPSFRYQAGQVPFANGLN